MQTDAPIIEAAPDIEYVYLPPDEVIFSAEIGGWVRRRLTEDHAALEYLEPPHWLQPLFFWRYFIKTTDPVISLAECGWAALIGFVFTMQALLAALQTGSGDYTAWQVGIIIITMLSVPLCIGFATAAFVYIFRSLYTLLRSRRFVDVALVVIFTALFTIVLYLTFLLTLDQFGTFSSVAMD